MHYSVPGVIYSNLRMLSEVRIWTQESCPREPLPRTEESSKKEKRKKKRLNNSKWHHHDTVIVHWTLAIDEIK